MPDYDQNQDFDNADGDNDPVTGPDTGYCGPTAVANSLWWFDHKFPEREIVDPAKTIYEVIEELAGYMGTNDGPDHPSPNGHPGPYGGTYVDDMQTGIDDYLAFYGLTDLLYEHTEPMPSFDYIANEVERCQDVVLLLGFWHIDLVEFDPASGELIIWWARHGGHYVTVAGVNRTARMIAISDPDADAAEAGAPGVVRGIHNHGATDFRDPTYDHTLHNDKPLASHDYYGVGPSPSPGGIEALLAAGDPLIYGPPMVPYHRNENEDSSPPVPIWYPPGAWDDFGYPWPDYCQYYTEIEYAVIVSPLPTGACCCSDGTCDIRTRAACEGDPIGCVYLGDDTICGDYEACCDTADGSCTNAFHFCCLHQGVDPTGTPSGDGTDCFGSDLGCCGTGGQCDDMDPVCCDLFGDVPQTELCANTTEACCLGPGFSPDCIEVDPVCCDEEGGVPSPTGETECLGDLNMNGKDDACEAPQACCLPNGTCAYTGHSDCVDRGGDPQGPGTDCGTVACNPLKWAQPPTFNTASPNPDCFWGWDEVSMYNSWWHPVLSDDWLCTDDRPVTNIHWWGSYVGWNGDDPPAVAPTQFHIAIWSDTPAVPGGPFSHPNTVLKVWTVDRVGIETRVGCDFYPGALVQDTCFRYDFDIPEGDEFVQDPTTMGHNVYWVSIGAIYDSPTEPTHPWGWKTRLPSWNDDAVRIQDPNVFDVGTAYVSGVPVAVEQVSWDLAFVLTTDDVTDSKWEQAPNPAWSGHHCHDDATGGITCADDWKCEGGRVTDLHWWGNYEDDDIGSGIRDFHLSIHADIPGPPFSRPGALIWEDDVPIGAGFITETDTGLTNNAGDRIYLYEYILPDVDQFDQVEGFIYWLDIRAQSNNPEQAPARWRWQEHSRGGPFRLDSAVYSTPVAMWSPLNSDLAFRITSVLCPPSDPPLVPAGEAGYEKVRYISMEPVNPGRLTALRVTMTTIPPPYAGFSGTRCWVGEPATYCENAGVVSPPCPTVIPNTDFVGADLGGAPHCMDWSTVGVLHVSDDDIVPNAVYDVQAIDCNCDFGNEANYSAALTITTSIWGDAVRNCAVYPCGPPDGTVGIPTDVTAILDKFKNLGPPLWPVPAVLKSRADLDYNIPNRRVDISDVTFCLDAFRGFTYPPLGPALWPGPDGCP